VVILEAGEDDDLVILEAGGDNDSWFDDTEVLYSRLDKNKQIQCRSNIGYWPIKYWLILGY